jgi:mRNA interferase RelE/StbE
MISQKVKKRLFIRRERAAPLPPLEVNSSGPTLTEARRLIALGLLAEKIDALAENPFLGKPLGNKMGLDLTGFYKLYVSRKKYPLVYRLEKQYLEFIEIIGIGKREKQELYKRIFKHLAKLA